MQVCFNQCQHFHPRLALSPAPAGAETGSCRRKQPHTTHPHNYPEQVTIIRPAHPFEGKSLAVLGYTHRNDRLHLPLILPDGSKSLVPSEWTNLNSTFNCTSHNHSATLAFGELLCMRTVMDALLRRLASAAEEAAKPINHKESTAPKQLSFLDPRLPETYLWEQLDPEQRNIITFLLLNGVNLEASQDEKYLTFLRLAQGTLTEEQLANWIRKRI